MVDGASGASGEKFTLFWLTLSCPATTPPPGARTRKLTGVSDSTATTSDREAPMRVVSARPVAPAAGCRQTTSGPVASGAARCGISAVPTFLSSLARITLPSGCAQSSSRRWMPDVPAPTRAGGSMVNFATCSENPLKKYPSWYEP